MSEPKRYFLKISRTISGLRCDTFEDKDGMYVDYEDYARLKAECQARQAENSVLAVECDSLKAEVERLTSDIQMEKENEDRLVRLHQDARNEVERLTKAGDEMVTFFPETGRIANAWHAAKHAAKEGKQS